MDTGRGRGSVRGIRMGAGLLARLRLVVGRGRGREAGLDRARARVRMRMRSMGGIRGRFLARKLGLGSEVLADRGGGRG